MSIALSGDIGEIAARRAYLGKLHISAGDACFKTRVIPFWWICQAQKESERDNADATTFYFDSVTVKMAFMKGNKRNLMEAAMMGLLKPPKVLWLPDS